MSRKRPFPFTPSQVLRRRTRGATPAVGDRRCCSARLREDGGWWATGSCCCVYSSQSRSAACPTSVRPRRSPAPRVRQVVVAQALAALPGFGETSAAAATTATDTPAPDLCKRDTLTGDWSGLRTTLLDAGVTLDLSEQSELWTNLTGGSRRGVVYDGLTTASVSLDPEKLTGRSGATLFVSAFQVHRRGPSGNLDGRSPVRQAMASHANIPVISPFTASPIR